VANVLYDSGREGILDTTIDMTGDVRCVLVKSSYTFSAAHNFMDDIGTDDNGRSAALSGKTYTAGVFDASDISLTATSAVACEAIVLFQHTGVDATARLIAYIDTPTSGLPFTPSASQTVNIVFDSGANRIFKL
jgi:hypothetical protein